MTLDPDEEVDVVELPEEIDDIDREWYTDGAGDA